MKLFKTLTAFTLLIISSFTFANDKAELNQLLNDFLANTVQNDLKNHDRFWAEDLVYTSSSGTRFDKSVIIDGIKKETEEASAADAPTYWAEETDIRLYGTTAIVAFKLAAKWTENNEVKKQYYFNTGTFLKRDGKWAVIAWQATKIPQEQMAKNSVNQTK